MADTATLRSSLRALLGAYAGDRGEPLPPLPDGLPASLEEIAHNCSVMLVHYQGVAHARLYLQRLRRFRGRIDDNLLARIATLMAERMAYQDSIRLAQITLDEAAVGGEKRRRCVFRLDELIEPLPAVVSAPMLDVLRLLGWQRRTMVRTYSTATTFGRGRLRIESGLRRWRSLGSNYERERVWVERWLHMIDRALTKRPEVAYEIAETATMIQGYGEPYRQALAAWHLIIDGLVKPTFDGAIVMPDLTAAIAAAREAADDDPDHTRLNTTIAVLRDAAPSAAAAPVPSRAIPNA